MQHKPNATENLVSVAAAAKEIGVNRSTLLRQVKTGQIRSYNGLVRLSEVAEDRCKSVQTRRARRGRGVADHAPKAVASDRSATSGVASAPGVQAPVATSRRPRGSAATATGSRIPTQHQAAVLEAFARLLGALDPLLASTLVEAKAPMPVVYAGTCMLSQAMLGLIDDQLEAAGVEGFSTEDTSGMEEMAMRMARCGRQLPDWKALAKQAGERFDLNGWDAYLNALPWWGE